MGLLSRHYDIYSSHIFCKTLTAKGSACSQLISSPHEAFLLLRLSGTMKMMNIMLNTAIMVAIRTTWVSPWTGLESIMYVPSAGLITRLAANVAETCVCVSNVYAYYVSTWMNMRMYTCMCWSNHWQAVTYNDMYSCTQQTHSSYSSSIHCLLR